MDQNTLTDFITKAIDTQVQPLKDENENLKKVNGELVEQIASLKGSLENVVMVSEKCDKCAKYSDAVERINEECVNQAVMYSSLTADHASLKSQYYSLYETYCYTKAELSCAQIELVEARASVVAITTVNVPMEVVDVPSTDTEKEYITYDNFKALCDSNDILTEYDNYNFHTVVYAKFGKYDDSALHYFYRKNSKYNHEAVLEITQLLVKCGVDVNSKNNNHHTAYYTLLTKSSDNYSQITVDCLEFLIDEGYTNYSDDLMSKILVEDNNDNEYTYLIVQILCANDYSLTEKDIQYAFNVIEDYPEIAENMCLTRESVEDIEIKMSPGVIDFLTTLE